jgi:ribosomal protein S6--L-glutamate ligase
MAMPEADIVLLSYPDVTPQNVTLLRAAAAKRDIGLHEWIPHRISIWCANGHAEPLYENSPREPAVIIHRTIARLQAFVIPALRLWAGKGSVIVNDLSASVTSRDKLATAVRLTGAGLPTVPSLGFMPWESLDLDHLPSGATVIKPAHGLQGQGVSFFASRAGAEAEARAICWSEARDIVSEYYLAQPVVGSPGQDIRAYVVGGACIALARRRSTEPGEHRANITLGAVAATLALDHPAAALAVAATEALGLDYAGVDLLEAEDGQLQILEVDAWAGFAGLELATGADISGRILDMALAKLRRSQP